MKRVDVIRRESGELLVGDVRWCSSRLCRLRGLQFSRSLDPLLLVYAGEGVAQTSIHMFFVFFPIAAIWIDAMGRVTSVQLAEPWHPYYGSPEPAQYVLEADPALLDQVRIGDELNFVLST